MIQLVCRRAPHVWSFGLGALLVAARLLAQPATAGGEFQVNSHTPSYQNRVAAAMENNGDFVVVWHSGLQDGNNTGVFGQRFASSGVRQGAEFHVSTYTVNYQARPQIAMDDDGDFVVVWFSFAGQDGDLSGVFGQRFDSAGARQGGEFQINTRTISSQLHTKVAMDSDGDFVVVWHSAAQDGPLLGVFARRYNAAGAPQAAEFQVNSYTIGDQTYPAIGIGPGGAFVVGWQSLNQDGDSTGVFAQRFSSTGVTQGGEFKVNTYTVAYQNRVEVAHDESGAFIVVWHSSGQDGDLTGAFAQRFDSAGARLGGEFQVNTRTASYQTRPKVAIDSAGRFEVIWYSVGQDGDASGVFGQGFSSLGAAQGGEFRVSTYTVGAQNYPAVAMSPVGDFVVAWTSLDQDGDNNGVFAQRFRWPAGPTLDVDGTGVLAALSDGLLILRYFFGFRGGALIGGAIGGGCARCTAGATEAYLSAITSALDADGNGSSTALTDGVLILRYLFGFTGAALSNGAVGMGCTRCDAGTIVPYLDALAS